MKIFDLRNAASKAKYLAAIAGTLLYRSVSEDLFVRAMTLTFERDGFSLIALCWLVIFARQPWFLQQVVQAEDGLEQVENHEHFTKNAPAA